MVFPVNEVDEGKIVALARRPVVLQLEEKASDVTQIGPRRSGNPQAAGLSPPLHAGRAGLA